MDARTTVALIFGGQSAEHEISILSARTIAAALDPIRFALLPIGIDTTGRWLLQDAAKLLAPAAHAGLLTLSAGERIDPHTWLQPDALARGPRIDVAFPALHGPCGEDGCVQGLLELAGIPYVGAGVLGSAVGMDKDVMKRLLREAGLPTPRHLAFRSAEFIRDRARVLSQVSALGWPVFVKPANLGSSIGVSRANSMEELVRAIELAFRHDVKIVIEEDVAGRELECAVLGNETPVASLVGEIQVTHGDGFYSYDAKYRDDSGARLCIPADIAPALARRAQQLALQAFTTLECTGLARVDFFLRGDELLLNEINTLPGFTAVSMYPRLWRASGLPLRQLTSRLIELAIERHQERSRVRRAG